MQGSFQVLGWVAFGNPMPVPDAFAVVVPQRYPDQADRKFCRCVDAVHGRFIMDNMVVLLKARGLAYAWELPCSSFQLFA